MITIISQAAIWFDIIVLIISLTIFGSISLLYALVFIRQQLYKLCIWIEEEHFRRVIEKNNKLVDQFKQAVLEQHHAKENLQAQTSREALLDANKTLKQKTQTLERLEREIKEAKVIIPE